MANVSLNGIALGFTRNQHRRYRYDVTDIVKDAGNLLVVVLHPATVYADSEAATFVPLIFVDAHP